MLFPNTGITTSSIHVATAVLVLFSIFINGSLTESMLVFFDIEYGDKYLRNKSNRKDRKCNDENNESLKNGKINEVYSTENDSFDYNNTENSSRNSPRVISSNKDEKDEIENNTNNTNDIENQNIDITTISDQNNTINSYPDDYTNNFMEENAPQSLSSNFSPNKNENETENESKIENNENEIKTIVKVLSRRFHAFEQNYLIPLFKEHPKDQ